MDDETLEILKLISSSLIPVAVVAAGIFINKGMERIKTSLSKEKSWNEAWANKFLRIVTDYSDTVSAICVGLYVQNQIAKEQLDGWEAQAKTRSDTVNEAIRKLQHYEWELRTHVSFAATTGEDLLERHRHVFDLISKMIENKKGDLNEVLAALIKFNESAKRTHAELLGITHT